MLLPNVFKCSSIEDILKPKSTKPKQIFKDNKINHVIIKSILFLTLKLFFYLINLN